MADDLFAMAAAARLASSAPLAARLRPTSLDDVVGQEHLLGAGRPLRVLIETDRLTSLILTADRGFARLVSPRVLELEPASGALKASAGWRTWFS